MTTLSPAGSLLVQDLSRRYGVSIDAITHMLLAVQRGNGSMAQFNHSEFGGAGQWMSGGMTMVSDLFNNHLKNLVNNLCSELATALVNHQTSPFSGSFQSQSQSGSHMQAQAAGQTGTANSLFVPDPMAQWWPRELGHPSAIGSQNSLRYAYFADSHRLAVTTGGKPWVYDTLDHRIGGFGQQQGGGQSITFTSQYGTVDISTLPVVVRDGVPVQAAQAQTPRAQAPMQTSFPADQPVIDHNNVKSSAQSGLHLNQTGGDDVIAILERLGQLMEKGYISKDEFEKKKGELLSRI